jgi:hypothetical protein
MKAGLFQVTRTSRFPRGLDCGSHPGTSTDQAGSHHTSLLFEAELTPVSAWVPQARRLAANTAFQRLRSAMLRAGPSLLSHFTVAAALMMVGQIPTATAVRPIIFTCAQFDVRAAPSTCRVVSAGAQKQWLQ